MAVVILSLLLAPLLGIYVIVVLLVLDMDRAYAQYALVLPVSYILGSIPWGFLTTLAVRGVDIRQYGSGKTGFSNVLRTSGGPFASVALILDLSKGLLAVLLAKVVGDTATIEVAAGLLALAGHNWSVFLGFTGGRGIVTGTGALLMMEPIAAAVAFAVFTPITLFTRYLSLGSIIAVTVPFISVAVLVLLDRSSAVYLAYVGVAGAIILWQHRDNIRRLLQGKERRLGQPAEGPSEASSPGLGRG